MQYIKLDYTNKKPVRGKLCLPGVYASMRACVRLVWCVWVFVLIIYMFAMSQCVCLTRDR